MKVQTIKKKVVAKVNSAKAKIADKTKKAKAVLFACVFASALLSGCSTADAPTAQRAQNNTVKDVVVNISVTAPTNAVASIAPSIHLEIATAAQANETSGTESMTNTPTQTPTNHIPTDVKLTYGLASDSAAGTDWINQLTSASAKGLSEWLKSSNANGEITLTKTDGTTETVSCTNGVCTTSSGACVTCSECTPN